jgi:hypothetical protein
VSLTNLLDRLYETGWAVTLRENGNAFPWVECIHVLAISLVVGSISIVDLRLLGLAWRDRPVRRVLRDVLPVTWTAFGLAVISGFLMFASNAPTYARNPFLQLKLCLILVAGVNMSIFHLWARQSLPSWETAPALPLRAKVAGAVSLISWIGVVAAARWIGFTVLSPS